MTATVIRNEKFTDLTVNVNEMFNTADKLMEKIQRVCCFTSLLAVFNLAFFIGVPFNGALGSVVAFLGLLGVASGIVACPMKFIKNALTLCGSAFLMGLAFVVVGCFIGLAIGVFVSCLMIFIAPAFVTIPHYFNELK